MAAVPVGTVILNDTFTSGSWAASRAPDTAYGGMVWDTCTNGTISSGDLIGTQAWNSGINDHHGVSTPSGVIETTGYTVTVVVRNVSGAPISGGNSWEGALFNVFSDGAQSTLEGRVGVTGTIGGFPSISVWGESGGEAREITDVGNLAADTYYTLRVDVGTLRQDYYWNGVLKTQTFREANLSIGSIEYNLGFSYTGTTSVNVTTIEDIAPPEPEPGVPFWTAFLGAHEVVGGAAPITPPESTLIDVPYTETISVSGEFVRWFSFVIGVSDLYSMDTLQTVDQETDTSLAVFDSDGTLITTNEDYDEGANIFVSQIVAGLNPGTYYLALAMYPAAANAANGFVMPDGDTPLASDIILNVAVST
jgi:hypothetical protein